MCDVPMQSNPRSVMRIGARRAHVPALWLEQWSCVAVIYLHGCIHPRALVYILQTWNHYIHEGIVIFAEMSNMPHQARSWLCQKRTIVNFRLLWSWMRNSCAFRPSRSACRMQQHLKCNVRCVDTPMVDDIFCCKVSIWWISLTKIDVISSIE